MVPAVNVGAFSTCVILALDIAPVFASGYFFLTLTGRGMKIFISWSGDLSEAIAAELRSWLKKVVQSAEPWVSSKDLRLGDRWFSELGVKLNEMDFGIFCLTPGHTEAPWLLFEAGAIGKAVDRARVIPLLFGIEVSQITTPLSLFQLAKGDRQGIKDLVNLINKSAAPERQVDAADLDDIFELWWPKLECKVREILASSPEPTPKKRETDDILEELVATVRSLERRHFQYDTPSYYSEYFKIAPDPCAIDILKKLALDKLKPIELMSCMPVLIETYPQLAPEFIEFEKRPSDRSFMMLKRKARSILIHKVADVVPDVISEMNKSTTE